MIHNIKKRKTTKRKDILSLTVHNGLKALRLSLSLKRIPLTYYSYQQVDRNMNFYKNTLKFHFTSFLDKFFLIKERSPYNLRRQVIWYYILHGSFQI